MGSAQTVDANSGVAQMRRRSLSKGRLQRTVLGRYLFIQLLPEELKIIFVMPTCSNAMVMA